MSVRHFSIQSLILLTLIAALILGWWLDHKQLREELRKANKRIQLLETSRFMDDVPQIKGRQ